MPGTTPESVESEKYGPLCIGRDDRGSDVEHEMSKPVLAVIAGLSTALLVGCTSASAPEPSFDGSSAEPRDQALAEYYDQALQWEECAGGAQCADLRVPLDYDDVSAGDITIAVSRLPASGERRGSLVFNPGGPGGSGVEFVPYASSTVSPAVLRKYDFVGFDPRGVGKSEPIDCLTDEQTDQVLAANTDPQTDKEIAEYQADSELIAKGCEKNSADLLAHVDSASVVNDMDILRAALGDPKLDYLGKSYGSKLGAMYANTFPLSTGRMVLDGILPPDLPGEEISRGQAEGFEDSLRRYVEWCLAGSNCPLTATDVDGGVQEIQQFFDQLDNEPLPVDDRELTGGLAMQAVLYYLYFPFAGDWDRLNRGLAEAFAGNGRPLVTMLDERIERDSAGNYKNNGNSYDAFVAITCLDDGSDATTAEVAKRAEEWAETAPTFGPALAWSELVCVDWPVPSVESPGKAEAVGAGTILVVSTSHDPATPLPWAEQLAADLTDSRLVVVDADGHTAYQNGSACVDRTVNEFLLTGTPPAEDVICEDGWDF